MDDREPHPPLENRSVGLLKTHRLATRDAKRLEHRRGRPRELGARVGQDIAQQSPVPFSQRGFDLDIGAEKTHVVGHRTSLCLSHYYQIIACRVKRVHFAVEYGGDALR